MATTIVEFATADGLARYEITDQDLSGVAAEHLQQVTAAISAGLVVAPDAPDDPEADDAPAPDAGDSPEPTSTRGKKE
jgi:hypothetical protein